MSSRGPLGAEGQGQLPALPPLNPDLLANIVSSSFDTITGQMSFGGWNISPEKTAASFERKTLRFSSLSCLQQRWPLCLACSWGGVTFSVYDSAPVAKFLNPGPEIFQIWESDSRSDFGYNHRSNRNLHRRTRRGAGGGGLPPGLEKFQGKLCFQGNRKFLKNPEY